MKKIKRAIREIYNTLNSIIIVEHIMNTVIVFLAAYLIAVLINLDWKFAVPIAVVYLITVVLRDLQQKLNNQKLVVVEKLWPELDERLRTAADSKDIENPVVDELQKEVLDDLKKVSVSSFFNIRKTSMKMAGAVALCFLIMIATVAGFKLMDMSLLIRQGPGMLTGQPTNETSDSDELSAGSQENADLYGEESIAELGSTNVNLEINTLSFELTNVRQEEEVPDSDFEEKFPDEVSMMQDCGTDCVLRNNIPVEEQDLVKNYFIKLAET